MAQKLIINVELLDRKALARLKALGASVRNIGTKAKVAGNQSQRAFAKASKASTGLGASIKGVALAFVGVTAAIAGIRSAFTTIIDFEKAMVEVFTLIDTGKVNTDALTQSVRELSKQFGKDLTDQARALYNAISSGAVTAENSMQLLIAANILSIAGITSVAKSVEALTIVMNTMGFSVENATEISDILFSTMKDARTTVDELAESMSVVTPSAFDAGISFNALAAAVGVVSTRSKDTRLAVNQLKQLLVALGAPTTAATAFAAKLGFVFDETTVKTLGLAGTLEFLQEKTGGSATKLRQLFGSVEAVQASLKLTADGLESFNKLLENNTASAGLTKEGFDKLSQTLDQRLNVSIAELKDAALSLTPVLEILVAILTPLAKTIGFVASGFEFLSQAAKETKQTIQDLEEAKRLDIDSNLSLAETLERLKEVQLENAQSAREASQALTSNTNSLKENADAADKALIAKLALIDADQKLIEIGKRLVERFKTQEERLKENLQTVDEAIEAAKRQGIEEEKLNKLLETRERILKRLSKEQDRRLPKTKRTNRKLITEHGRFNRDLVIITEDGAIQQKQTFDNLFDEIFNKGLLNNEKNWENSLENLKDIGLKIFQTIAQQAINELFKIERASKQIVLQPRIQIPGIPGGAGAAAGGGISGLLGKIFGGIFGGGGDPFIISEEGAIGGLSAGIGSVFGFKKGGIAKGGFDTIKNFAHGGVIDSPTLGLIGEAGRNEAVVPLPDNRNIPVRFLNEDLRGPGGQTVTQNFNFNIAAMDSASFQEFVRSNPKGIIEAITSNFSQNGEIRDMVGGKLG